MNTLSDVLSRLDRRDAGITFEDAGGTFVAYDTLLARVRGNARHFARQGVRPGERVALALHTDEEHVITFLALVALGAVPVSVKPGRGDAAEHAEDVRRVASRFDVRRVVRSLPHVTVAPPLAWDPHAESRDPGLVLAARPEDPAFVQFSSGSLGEPKAIPIRHESLVANLRAILALDGRDSSLVGYNFLPLSHDMGLVGGLLSNLVLQNRIHLQTTRGFLRRPAGFFRAAPPGDVAVAMPDFALRYLLRSPRQARGGRPLASVKTVYCGAEPIRHETVAALSGAADALGLDPAALVFSYGMAEATLVVTARRFDSLDCAFARGPKGRHVANVGRPIADTEVAIGARGQGGAIALAPEGTEGEIFVRGPGVFAGYLGDDGPPGGWHATGDLGFVAGGDLHISGRAKDLIIIHGENVFPGDIESFVARLPGVEEALVMADDSRFYLYVVPRALVDADSIAAQVGIRFGATPAGIAQGAPGRIRRTTSGKPMRQATLDALRAAGALAGEA